MNPQAVDSLSKQTIYLTAFQGFVRNGVAQWEVGTLETISGLLYIFICLLVGVFLCRSHWNSRPSAF